jgi:hypothetical protein
VRETICCALEASHDHYEQTFRGREVDSSWVVD